MKYHNIQLSLTELTKEEFDSLDITLVHLLIPYAYISLKPEYFRSIRYSYSVYDMDILVDYPTFKRAVDLLKINDELAYIYLTSIAEAHLSKKT